jgi:hypothetical protein
LGAGKPGNWLQALGIGPRAASEYGARSTIGDL